MNERKGTLINKWTNGQGQKWLKKRIKERENKSIEYLQKAEALLVSFELQLLILLQGVRAEIRAWEIKLIFKFRPFAKDFWALVLWTSGSEKSLVHTKIHSSTHWTYEVCERERSKALIYGIYYSKNLTCFCGRVVSKIHSSTLIFTCLWTSKRVLTKSLKLT